MLQRGRRSESTEMIKPSQLEVTPGMLQRGRRSESTEIGCRLAGLRRCRLASKGPSIRVDGDRSPSMRGRLHSRSFKGAVDQSRRRCGSWRLLLLKLIGLQRGRRSESTEMRSGATDGRRGRLASKGPSIRVDGDRQGAARAHNRCGASKGPSIRVDGDQPYAIPAASSTLKLQRGRRSESTEILRVDDPDVLARRGFKGAVDQSRRRYLERPAYRPRAIGFKGAVDQSRRR